MTNIQKNTENRNGGLAPAMLPRLWFWAPIALGGVLSALLLFAMALPQRLAIIRDQQRLNELEARRQEADLLKLQTLKTLKERREALERKESLIKLVAGPGDLATVLATLDLEARKTGVKLQLFEPAPPPPAPAQPAQGSDAKTPPPPPDPMEEAGLKKHPLLLSARGTYPQLLAFMRRVELLDVLVEQSNLTLSMASDDSGPAKASAKDLLQLAPQVDLKLKLALYSRKAKEKDTAQPSTEGAPKEGKATNAPAPPG